MQQTGDKMSENKSHSPRTLPRPRLEKRLHKVSCLEQMRERKNEMGESLANLFQTTMALNGLKETLKRKVLLRRNRRMDLTTFWMSTYCFGLKRLCLIFLPALVCGTVREKVDGHHVHSCQSGSCDLES